MKKYEAVFILDMRKVEDEGKAFSEEFAQNIQGWGGSVTESVAMGRKQFAREIEKRKAGIYWNYILELDPLKVKEIRDKYRLDERIVRMLIISFERPEQVRSTMNVAPDITE
ncbi:MAG: 30S ribosomal protein S6 [Lentisphaerae bacterium ADurb.Bin242]|nr:MAG: 30S ribosomal protein S6 [Lentisphaerae bacterium ADurb.Bin242]